MTLRHLGGCSTSSPVRITTSWGDQCHSQLFMHTTAWAKGCFQFQPEFSELLFPLIPVSYQRLGVKGHCNLLDVTIPLSHFHFCHQQGGGSPVTPAIINWTPCGSLPTENYAKICHRQELLGLPRQNAKKFESIWLELGLSFEICTPMETESSKALSTDSASVIF